MKNKYKLTMILSVIIISFIYTGCGNTSDDINSNFNIKKISLCNDNLSTWVKIVKDDIVKAKKSTSLKFDHDENNIKRTQRYIRKPKNYLSK